MSVENRKRVYEELKKAGRLSQDDGALEREFGIKEVVPQEEEKKPVKVKKGRKKK